MDNRILLKANDPWITRSQIRVRFFLAVCLTGCITASTSPDSTTAGSARADSDSIIDEWEFCHDQIYAVIEPRLRANEQCGASNCFDDHGNSLQQLVVQHCGYPEHSAEETNFLMEMIQQAIKSKEGLASREIRTLYYYPPNHPASIAAARAQAIADEQRAKAAEAEKAQANEMTCNIKY